jgi:tRNA threonylcarbamoyladenosine biosynthesis protein TsaB
VILGFDTATAATAVAVWAPDGPAVECRDDPPAGERPGHASRLLVLVEEALAAAGASWDAIERLAVGVGPGGFTGLRIGIASARALAQARGLPVVGVSSLEALAAGAADEAGGRPVVAVIDARRGEVFAAAYGSHPRGDSPPLPAFGPLALAPEALAARIEAGSMAVGDGAVRFREELERAGAAIPADVSPLHRVTALQVCRIGAAGEPADRDALLPDYRREPDAKPRIP